MRRFPSWRGLMPWILGLSLLCNVGVLAGYLLQPLFQPQETPAEPAGKAEAPPASSDRFVAELSRVTELEAEQAKAIAQAREALMAGLVPLRESMKAMKHRLVQLLVTDTPDLPALRAATREIADSQRELQDRTVDHLITVRKGLHAHQRAGFDQLLQERMCPNPLCTGTCIGSCQGCGGHSQGQGDSASGHQGCACGGGGALPFEPGGMGGACGLKAAEAVSGEGAVFDGDVKEPSCHGANP